MIHGQTGGIYNGIFGGSNYYIGNADAIVEAINSINRASKIDTINGLFTFPSALVGQVQEIGHGLYKISNTNNAYGEVAKIKIPTTLNGYVPRNNKLFVYPYNYLAVDNAGGQSNIYRYEFFENVQNNEITFNIRSAITPGGSIRMEPVNYNGDAGFVNGLPLAKFPICNWAVDMYTNWLTQNSVNIGGFDISADLVNTVGSGLNASIQAVTGNIQGAFTSVFNSMLQTKQHSLLPTVAKGNLNAGDVIASSNKLNYHFCKMCVRVEYARKIDEFFTRFGYKVNRLTTPYINIRPYWDYLKIGGEEDLGSGEMPQVAIDTINQCARNGVTIWHDHAVIGDYTLDNSAPIKE